MQIIVKRTEEDLFNIIKNQPLSLKSIREYLELNDAFKHLEEFRFNDDYNILSNNIYKSLKDIPKLRDEINALASSVHIDTQYLSNVVDKLTKKSDTKITICTGVTGFDCAAGAYDRTIYIGLEWFCNPDILGISKDDYRYPYMCLLSNNITNFMQETLPHEMVHILSKKPDENSLAFRIIEEGRACYVTSLIFPEWDISKVLPMSCEDLSMAMENEEELIKVANESLEINSSETVRKMFSPTGKLMDIGLSGYYLSFILFGRIFGNIDNIEDRIGIIMNYSDGDEVLLEFKLMINS
jgi:hypothetical protein